MKLSSLLYGDFADVFQDERIEEAATTAQAASSAAINNKMQTTRLAHVVEKRIREVEQENAILSMLLLRILKYLAESQPEQTQKIVDEVGAVMRSGKSTSPDLLRQILDLPPLPKTPINDYFKPVITRPTPRPKRPIESKNPIKGNQETK